MYMSISSDIPRYTKSQFEEFQFIQIQTYAFALEGIDRAQNPFWAFRSQCYIFPGLQHHPQICIIWASSPENLPISPNVGPSFASLTTYNPNQDDVTKIKENDCNH